MLEVARAKVNYGHGLARRWFAYWRARRFRKLMEDRHVLVCPCRYSYVNFKFPFIHYYGEGRNCTCICEVLLMFEQLQKEINELKSAAGIRDED